MVRFTFNNGPAEHILPRFANQRPASTSQLQPKLWIPAKRKLPDQIDDLPSSKKNINRGLDYISIDFKTAKLFIMVNALFANNRDLSSQIGYIVILGNKVATEEFSISRDSDRYSRFS
jgi:hypothetical protein